MARVDNEHSSISAHVDADTVWPDEDEWTRLRTLDGLHTEAHGTATPERRHLVDLRHAADARDRAGASHAALRFRVPLPRYSDG